MKISIHIDTSHFDATFNGMNQRGSDLSPVMRAIGFYGENITRYRFATETDPSGNPWIPSHRKREKGGKTLTLTGALASSVSSQYTATSATFGINRPYGKFHQYGTKYLPARPFLGLSQEDETEITRLLSEWILSG